MYVCVCVFYVSIFLYLIMRMKHLHSLPVHLCVFWAGEEGERVQISYLLCSSC